MQTYLSLCERNYFLNHFEERVTSVKFVSSVVKHCNAVHSTYRAAVSMFGLVFQSKMLIVQKDATNDTS